jgi:copper chaperone CopZ
MMATTTNAHSQTTIDTALVQDSATVAKVKVKGITCAMDLKMISANVEKLQGVDKCETAKQGPTTTFEVKYNPVLVSEKEIYAAIEGTGSCENPDERPYKVKQ